MNAWLKVVMPILSDGKSTFFPNLFSLKKTNAITAAVAKVVEYTKKGALSEIAERMPPKAGPVMPPSRNPPLNND